MARRGQMRCFCRKSWLAALLLFLLAGATAHAQSKNLIEGHVYGADGKALSGIPVTLKTTTGLQLDQLLTSYDGLYGFPNLWQGSYLVVVEPPEPYLPKTELVGLPTGLDDYLRVDFYLEIAAHQAPATAPEPLFVQEVPPEAEQAYTKGIDYLQAGKTGQGVKELRRAVGLFSSYYLALNQLGWVHMQRGEAGKAEGWFRQACAVNPNSASARFGLGWAYYQAERLEEATRELQRSVELNAHAAHPYYFLGMTTLELERWTEAAAAFEKCVELSEKGEHPLVYVYLTSVYDHLAEYAKAVEALKTYLKLAPEMHSPKLENLLARLERKQEQSVR